MNAILDTHKDIRAAIRALVFWSAALFTATPLAAAAAAAAPDTDTPTEQAAQAAPADPTPDAAAAEAPPADAPEDAMQTSADSEPSREATDFSLPFEKYTLESNGLEVILSQDDALPIVAVNLWYHTGPLNEPDGRTGFAHLFEHLMFQGSAHVGDDKHFKLLDSAGATGINGTTDYDRTNYFETVPANQLPLALWLESDRMGFLRQALSQDKLDNQRAVVMNERRQRIENVPYGPSRERLVQTLFPEGHPYYGYVIGSMEDLKAATLQDVKNFYDKYYAPANATLAIVGDIDVQKTKELVQKYFGTLPRRQAPDTPQVDTPPIENERRVTVREPVQLPRVSMAWLSPKAYAAGDAECDVLASLLGQGKTSRLYQKLVYDLELAQDVAAYQESLELTSIFRIVVTGRPGVDPEKLEAEIDAIIAAIQSEAPSEHEVMRARNQLLTGKVNQLQKVGGFGGRADMLNRYNHYLGEPGYLSEDIARYERVTPNAVQERARSLLKSEARAVVITVPENPSQPSKAASQKAPASDAQKP